MDGKTKIVIAVAVLGIGVFGLGKLSESMKEDPPITGIQAEFVGEIGPGETFSRDMFLVKGITDTGKLVKLNRFDSKVTEAALNGSTCELELESQGYKTTVIADITREPVYQKDIGYPEEEKAQVTYYNNGDLEFSGSGEITNFTSELPWNDLEYSHVYIDEALKIYNMDNWFSDNEILVYCSDLPKTLKTAKGTFAGCTALEKTPEYFHCGNLKITDEMFAKCESLKEVDILPVNVSSAKYMFEDCVKLQTPVNLSKTSNLISIAGLHSGCTNLREAEKIPESVKDMSECYSYCINIQEAVKFPEKVENIASAYSDCTGLLTGASIPESVLDISDCYNNCTSLNGSLEINTDTPNFSGLLVGANTNGDKLKIFGNSGNLLAIQKETDNRNIVLDNPEAASRQHERMIREQDIE